MTPRHRMPILLMCLAFFTFVWPWIAAPSVRASDPGLYLRFAHFATDVQPVDVYADGKLGVKALKYKDVTDYLAFEMNALEFMVTPTGGTVEDSLLEQPIQITFAKAEGTHFTLVLIGSVKDKTLELVKLPADGSEAIGGAASGPIAVSGAWVRATAKPMGGMATPKMGSMSDMGAVSAAYMLIKNAGDTADQLIHVTCEAAGTVETHRTTVVNNVAKMEPVPAIDVPANGSTELKPGSYHIMLMKLKHDLLPGQTVSLTLTFKSGVSLTVLAPVKAP